MIGQELMAVPNFNEDDRKTNVNVYFPKGSWFDLRYNTKLSSTGAYVDIQTPLKEMPAVFLRGGKTIFTNNVDKVENTYDLNDEFNLMVAFDNQQGNILTSSGKLPALKNYNSKTSVNNCIKSDCFIDILSTYSENTKVLNLILSPAKFYDTDYISMSIKSLRIYGLNISSSVVSTNIDKFISNESLLETHRDVKYSFNANGDYIVIDILPGINILKEKIDIFFYFK
jgi:hypothetical protein